MTSNDVRYLKIQILAIFFKDFYQILLHTAAQMVFDLFDKIRRCLAADRLALTKVADQILAGLIDKTKNGPQRLFTTVFGIMPFAPALLIAKDCLNSSIDTDSDIGKMPKSVKAYK